jgi:hypothetical protein
MADSVSWPALAALVVSSGLVGTVVTKVLDRTSASAEVVRKGYADATEAMNQWGQFPLRVRRRTDDSPETVARLEALGAHILERLAYSTGWVAAESAPISQVYNDLVTVLRGEVSRHNRLAWASGPADTPSKMNISGPPDTTKSDDESIDYAGIQPGEWVIVQLFSKTIRYRFGWRRYLLPPPYVARRISRMSIVNEAKRAISEHSSRLMADSSWRPSNDLRQSRLS